MLRTETISVLVVDDHEVVRHGLAIFLHAFDDLALAGEASNGLEAIRLCNELNPDVILMDILMPEMDGITATRIIKENHPDVQIIALTSFKDENMAQAAAQAGAVDCLRKDASIDKLADAIRAAYIAEK